MHFIAHSHERNAFEKHVSAPLFRKTFLYEKKGAKAEITITGLGFYRLFLNGEDITKGKLAPYISNTDHYVCFDVYDVTDRLLDGRNAIGILLGNGMQNAIGGEAWNYDTAPFASEPKTALTFSVDGETVFESDESFLTYESPITFDDLRAGVHYDARREIDGWALPDFDDSGWDHAVPTDAPKGELRLCRAHPVTVEKELKPVAIIPSATGFIYDFGENNAGVCRLKIRGARGQKIVLTHGEMIIDGEVSVANIGVAGGRTPDAIVPTGTGVTLVFGANTADFCRLKIDAAPGRTIEFRDGGIVLDGAERIADVTLVGRRSRPGYLQTDVYVCRGSGVEEWEPDFTYHGFRYVGVRGITDAQATPDLLTCRVLHSDIRQTGGFSCDDPVVNRICEITARTDMANFVWFPTDCPQREKNGWTGDAALSAERIMLHFDAQADYEEWLAHIRKAQRPDGRIPCIIPSHEWGFVWKGDPRGCGPGWDRIIVELPRLLYKYKGDEQALFDNADAIRRYVGFLERSLNADGLADYGIGDWTEVGSFSESRYTTPAALTSTLICLDICRKAAGIFSAVGCPADAAYCRRLGEETKAAFRRAWLSADGALTCRTQTAQAMALYYGAFEPQEEAVAFRTLLDLIARDGERFRVGMLGARVLFRVLSRFGRSDLALKMVTREDFPGYGYLLKKGATTLWETFSPLGEGDSLLRTDGGQLLSLNHPAWGDVSAWFTETFGGIRVERADLIRVRPDVSTRIRAAEAFFENACGSVRVKWKAEAETVRLRVALTGRMTCTVFDDDRLLSAGEYDFSRPTP